MVAIIPKGVQHESPEERPNARLVRELKKVLLIKLHIELPEKREVLFFERLLGVMVILVLNITDHPIKVGARIRKSPKARLPIEMAPYPPLLVDETG